MSAGYLEVLNREQGREHSRQYECTEGSECSHDH